MLSDAFKRAEAAEAEVARLKALLGAGKRSGWCRSVDATDHPAGDVVKPPEPYTPRVGDVCVVTAEQSRASTLRRGDVVTITSQIGASSLWARKTGMERYLLGPDEIRRATAEERAAAGLPPEPCAKCGQVLPEPPGIGGEYPCKLCGVPTLHDSPAAPRVLPSDYADASAVAKHGEWLSAAMAVEAPAAPQVLPEHLAFLEATAEERSYMVNVTDTSMNKCDRAAHALRAAVARRDGGQK